MSPVRGLLTLRLMLVVQELLKQQILIQLFVLIGESDEFADPVGTERNVLRRSKTTGKKEFLKIGQYGFPLKCPLILKNQVIRIPYSMILRGNYECNENIRIPFIYR